MKISYITLDVRTEAENVTYGLIQHNDDNAHLRLSLYLQILSVFKKLQFSKFYVIKHSNYAFNFVDQSVWSKCKSSSHILKNN